MVYRNIDFWNCEELVQSESSPGLLVQRVPGSLRERINSGAQERVRNPDCVELRFTTSGESVAVTLSSIGNVRMLPMWGDFPAQDAIVIPDEPTAIEITYPERLSHLPRNNSGTSRFDRSVWRLQFTGRNGSLFFHDIEGEGLASPGGDVVPAKTLLTYGTSITHGSAATLANLSYAYQTARRLGFDLINLGVGGSCYAEPEYADYIAGRADWDLCILALSVNMIGAGFSETEFRNRVRYTIQTVASSNRDRPVFCVTIYPHIRDLVEGYTMPNDVAKSDTFREILTDEANNSNLENVHLIRGPEILDDPAGLTADLVHPSDYGMTLMSINLAERILGIIGA